MQKKNPAEKFEKFLFLTENFGAYKHQKTMNYMQPHQNAKKYSENLPKKTKLITRQVSRQKLDRNQKSRQKSNLRLKTFSAVRQLSIQSLKPAVRRAIWVEKEMHLKITKFQSSC